MKVDVLINAKYTVPELEDENIPELEYNFLRGELNKMLGPEVSITFRFEKNGKWEVLHG
jgi:hypothetical protein